MQPKSAVARLLLLSLLASPLLPGAVRLPHRKAGAGLPPDLSAILSHIDDAGKHLKSVSANLEYTKYTAVVSDKSTEEGRLFFHKNKSPEMRVEMESKIIVFKKNTAEIYYPRINQVQEYNLEQKSGLVEDFLLLGFGTEAEQLTKSYDVKYVKEEDVAGQTTALLELTPRKPNIASQITKILMWVSEQSWLPLQEQFFQPGGDYLIARYTSVKVNTQIPASTFEIHPAPGAKRVRMD